MFRMTFSLKIKHKGKIDIFLRVNPTNSSWGTCARPQRSSLVNPEALHLLCEYKIKYHLYLNGDGNIDVYDK